jgi:urease accessory protein
VPAEALRPGDGGSWRARLALQFAPGPGQTALVGRQHLGPLVVQKPFHPGDGSCHVYVLHPPGGLAGGDDLKLSAAVASGAAALLTMPASTKFYRSSGRRARVRNRLEVAAGASLEWLPPETILFGGCRAELATEIRLAHDAVFLGWEILALGRRRSGDGFAAGSFEQRLECFVDDRPLLLERTAASASDPVLTSAWGFAGHDYSATLLAWPADAIALEAARAALAGSETFRHGAPMVDGLLVLRVSGMALEALRAGLETVWQALAPLLLGRPALAPRIWKT